MRPCSQIGGTQPVVVFLPCSSPKCAVGCRRNLKNIWRYGGSLKLTDQLIIMLPAFRLHAGLNAGWGDSGARRAPAPLKKNFGRQQSRSHLDFPRPEAAAAPLSRPPARSTLSRGRPDVPTAPSRHDVVLPFGDSRRQAMQMRIEQSKLCGNTRLFRGRKDD